MNRKYLIAIIAIAILICAVAFALSSNITTHSVNIDAGNSRITMSRNIDKTKDKMTIKTSKLQITADDISFGSSGYSLVASPNPNLNFTLEDGSMLTTANNIRV